MDRTAPDVQRLALVEEHEGARVVEIISIISLSNATFDATEAIKINTYCCTSSGVLTVSIR